MPTNNPPLSEEMRRQLQAQVQSLRAAGIEWVPLGPPLEVIPKSEPRPLGSGQVTSTGENRKVIIMEPKTLPSSSAAPSENSLADRRQALTLLAKEVAKCTQCAALASTRTQTVFGQGEPGVEICFVGEAPGADEDAQGIPFVGAAGQLLTKIILACGLKREEVYICNTLKCRPPGNRAPLPDEAANCKGFLQRQIELVSPKFIVALGSSAVTNLLNTTQALGKLRGRFHDYQGIPVMVTYHPAYLLPHRSPEKKRDVWEDMKMLLTKMGRGYRRRENRLPIQLQKPLRILVINFFQHVRRQTHAAQ